MTTTSALSGLFTFASLLGLSWLAGVAVLVFPLAVIAGGCIALHDELAACVLGQYDDEDAGDE